MEAYVSTPRVSNNARIILHRQDCSSHCNDRNNHDSGNDKNSLKVNVNSTGFGLSFVKGVVDAHKGRVWAESAGVNQGSTFYMELPVK